MGPEHVGDHQGDERAAGQAQPRPRCRDGDGAGRREDEQVDVGLLRQGQRHGQAESQHGDARTHHHAAAGPHRLDEEQEERRPEDRRERVLAHQGGRHDEDREERHEEGEHPARPARQAEAAQVGQGRGQPHGGEDLLHQEEAEEPPLVSAEQVAEVEEPAEDHGVEPRVVVAAREVALRLEQLGDGVRLEGSGEVEEQPRQPAQQDHRGAGQQPPPQSRSHRHDGLIGGRGLRAGSGEPAEQEGERQVEHDGDPGERHQAPGRGAGRGGEPRRAVRGVERLAHHQEGAEEQAQRRGCRVDHAEPPAKSTGHRP